MKEESANVDENITLLKKFITANEGGLSKENRCVKCRGCIACKKADAGKLSSWEEQENELIREKGVGLNTEGRTFSSEDPPEKVSKDGISIGVAGMKWTSKVDAAEVKIPPLHFGKKVRGKLDGKTVFFDGEFADLDSFVPANLSKRIASSKLFQPKLMFNCSYRILRGKTFITKLISVDGSFVD